MSNQTETTETLTATDLAILDAFNDENETFKGVAKDDGYLRAKYISREIEVGFEMQEIKGMRRRIPVMASKFNPFAKVLKVGTLGQVVFDHSNDVWTFRSIEVRNITKFKTETIVTSDWVVVDIDEIEFKNVGR